MIKRSVQGDRQTHPCDKGDVLTGPAVDASPTSLPSLPCRLYHGSCSSSVACRLNNIGSVSQLMASNLPTSAAAADARYRVRDVVGIAFAVFCSAWFLSLRSYWRSDSVTLCDATLCTDEGLLSLQIPLIRLADCQRPRSELLVYERGPIAGATLWTLMLPAQQSPSGRDNGGRQPLSHIPGEGSRVRGSHPTAIGNADRNRRPIELKSFRDTQSILKDLEQ